MSTTSHEQLMKEMDEVLSAGGGSAASVSSAGSKTKNAAVAALEAKAAAALAQKQALAAAKEAEKAAKKAEKEAEKEAAKEAKKAEREVEKAAKKAAAEAEKAAEKAAKEAEKAAKKAAAEAEKAAKPKRPVGRPPKAKTASVASGGAEVPALLPEPAAELADLGQARLTVQALRAAESELRTRLAAMESAYQGVLARLEAVRQLVAA
jgi:membrane protein involved in colicin uptake